MIKSTLYHVVEDEAKEFRLADFARLDRLNVQQLAGRAAIAEQF